MTGDQLMVVDQCLMVYHAAKQHGTHTQKKQPFRRKKLAIFACNMTHFCWPISIRNNAVL